MVSSPIANTAGAAAQVLKPFDRNGDGQLSADEFLTLLTRLVSVIAPSGAGTLDRPLAAQITDQPRVQTTARTAVTYAPMFGFDTAKLNDPGHTTPKYVFARATQDLGVPSGNRATMSAALPSIVEYAKSHGFPNAQVVDSDEIDFGDGFGAIDVITSAGGWWWGPHA
jgi:hypothetical protein